jgi:hypothetical protein
MRNRPPDCAAKPCTIESPKPGAFAGAFGREKWLRRFCEGRAIHSDTGVDRDALVRGNDGVEGIADLACDPDLMAGQPHRKISGLHRVQRFQQLMLVKLRGSSVAVHSGLARAAFTRGVSRFAQSIAGFCARISSFATITGSGGRILIHDRSPGP